LDRVNDFNGFDGRMKIGLLGGSFNPAHSGHLYISLQAKKRLGLKQIWWLPNKQNPLKKITNSTFEKRFNQCLKITKNHPGIIIKDDENKLPSFYSIDLICRIIQKHPRQKFFWLMGADNIRQFHLWHNWQKIIRLMPIVIIDRENFFAQASRSRAALYAKKLENGGFKARYRFLKIKKSPLASSKIRNNLSKEVY
jgi:nicotinate-nucleotide adenylyltransferase